jgi:predicted phage gp36 major capsid-like protein
MINSINNTSQSSYGKPPAQQALSDDQKILITEVLENYDADSLTEEQAREIVDAFADAGIRPGQELASTLATEGFDAKNIGDLAGVDQRPPQQQASSESVDLNELVDYLDELLEQFSGESLSEENNFFVIESLQQRFGVGDGESILNISA